MKAPGSLLSLVTRQAVFAQPTSRQAFPAKTIHHDHGGSGARRRPDGPLAAGEPGGAGSLPAWFLCGLTILLSLTCPVRSQTLLNIDFGVGTASLKSGFAATGMGTNDFWNLYRHYDPKFTPGTPMVSDGKLANLKLADGSSSSVEVTVTNAPGVWGNATGDPMYDTYIFAQNGSNMTVTLTGLPAGRYHFFLYGHADPDVTGEQNPVFTLQAGTNTFGPLTPLGGAGWKSSNPWQERAQYVVFRDVPVDHRPVVIEVEPGPNGLAVLNGMQIISRGTAPPRLLAAMPGQAAPASTNLLFGQIRYDGKVTDTEARFMVAFDVESMTTNEISAPLFDGEVALLEPQLPAGLRIVSAARQSRLYCTGPGVYPITLEVVAKITRAEPWNQISFIGPPAAIASVAVTASAPGVEMQLLSGTQLEPERKAISRVSGFLGTDRTVALRWQSKAAEITRRALVTVETIASAQITPTVIKFNTQFRYEILQAPMPRLVLGLPANQTLTKVQGEQIRDWRISAGPASGLSPSGQILTVEFIKPVEKSSSLTLFTEQTIESTPVTATFIPPQPLEVERESGSLTVSSDDTLVEIESAPGLRQVNAASDALAAYRFNGRPISIVARLRRIEPVLKVGDRIAARLEETRLLVSHALTVSVEKAGIYALDLVPPPGFVVSEVRGEGVDDWKSAEGKLHLSFNSRVLGARKIDVQLEQAHKEFPESISLLPLVVAGATNVTVQIGAGSPPGIRLKTAEAAGLREVPVNSLPRGASPQPAAESQRAEAGRMPASSSDETLAFVSEQPDWKLALAAEKLAARVVAEVFNLVTVGDGLIGGSATIRYGILNQGVQEFRIALPAQWKNVEFTGANIRRKDPLTNGYSITLQDKAWGGYTLVITYDAQFDPKGATLDLAGAHPLGVERETGSLGLMTAASLKLVPAPPVAPLRRVDEAELSESDRALCTRPLLLAYKYTGTNFAETVQVTRFEELPVLEAAADRIELTTVVTEEGQMLTQASFMVKNNEKQFQRFKLPPKAEFWSSYVNSQPAKPERDGDWYLVPLPRDANRDQAFAVDIVYAQNIDLKRRLLPRRVALAAPVTDIPNTYAEWQLFVPISQRLSGFEGNMTVARGTTYGLHDAWNAFLDFYIRTFQQYFGVAVVGMLIALVVLLVAAAVRRGAKGVLSAVIVLGIVALLVAMIIPNFVKARVASQKSATWANLKQIGGAIATYNLEKKTPDGLLPANVEEMLKEYVRDPESTLTDVATGQRFVYVGAGKPAGNPDSIVLYSPTDENGRVVLFGDGSVKQLSRDAFNGAMQTDAAVPRAVFSPNAPAMPPAQMENQAALAGVAQRGGPVSGPAAPGRPVRAPAAALNQPLAVAQAGGVPGGGMGGFGANAIVPPPPASLPMKPTATGLRPIRIDVPHAGQAFSFTKVLNARSEPLTVTMSMMRMKVFRTWQSFIHVTAFVLGLGMLWWLARRADRSSFWMAVAVALVAGSVASHLIAWRLLHLGLIAAVPALLLLVSGWAAWSYWRRRQTAQAASASNTPPPPPVDSGSTPAAGLASIVLLALAAFAGSTSAQDLSTAALRAPLPAPSNSVSIVSATYTGTVQDKVARLDAAIALTSVATNQLVPLFGEDVAVESFAARGGAKLVREGRLVGALLPGRTNVVLQLKLIVKLKGDVTKRALGFGIPPALSSRVTVTIDEAEADVECPTAVAFTHQSTNQETRVEAVLGAADRLEMNWTPRVKRAAEIAATVFVQNIGLVTFGGGVMNVRATLDYQISQGELKQVRVALPAGCRLLRVEGEGLRTWEIKAGSTSGLPPASAVRTDEQVLVVDLVKGVSPAYRLSVETEKVLDKLPATVKVEIPRALEVKRETGLLALRASDELTLNVEQASEVQRVDAEEFYRAAPDKKDGLFSAFRFLKTDFVLSIRADTVQPQIEAVVRNNVRLGAESVRLNAQVDYTVKRAGVFALRLGLPAGYRLESVTGSNVLQWAERTEGGARLVDVTLKERTIGAYALNAALTQNYKEPPRTLAIAGVHPLDTQKLSGLIIVTTEHGLAAKTASFEGLTEVPFASVSSDRAASGGSALAFKFIAPQPAPQPAWKLSLTTETVEPWVRAETANTVTLTETLVSGRTLVKYEIANAPVKEFRLSVPVAFRNVEVSGAQIRRRDETNGQWRVELQGKVRGDYLLTVTWELPKSEKTNLVELSGVQALGVERESGWLSVIARPPLQVSEQPGSELLSKIDVRELPDWPGTPETTTVLAYRYLRPGYKLAVEARRFDEAEVLQALIDSARLTTVVADDGQMMTEVSLSIRNNGRQFVEIELPEKTTVWSAFVAGEPVRPSRREGRLLLPLERNNASDAPVTVELTFIGLDKFPKTRGPVALASPKFDVPLKNARWDLYLPPDYEYSRFEGSMSRAADSALPLVQVYSLAEYNVQQRAQEEQTKADVRNDLKVARDNLKGGNLRQAISSYSRSKTKGQQLKQEVEENRDLTEIEKDVRKAQSSNLIIAQNAFYLNNSARFGEQPAAQVQQSIAPVQMPAEPSQMRQGGATPNMYLNYDTEVAGQQWDKLEKAQQVAVAKVAPLRVNLPTRGVRFSFAQVLQTELRKPMTIQLQAENTKAPAWGARLALAVVGFGVLWLLVAALNRRQRV
jgi:hypothetical protein